MIHQPFFVPAVVLAIVSLPLVFALIPRNRFYGIRMQKTLSDDHAWYVVNRLGGVLVIISSFIYLIFAFLFPMSGRHDARFDIWLLHLCAFAVPLAISLIVLLKNAKRQ
jgi:uncharacterized membrane protein